MSRIAAFGLVRALGTLGFACKYVVFASVLAVVPGACNDSTAEKLKAAKLAEGCSINSDCSNPWVCAFARCHKACDEDRDCPTGQRCVKGEHDTNVCQLPDETSCRRDKDCKGDQICAVDLECRDSCTAASDCVADQTCVKTGECASTDGTRDALDPDGNLIPSADAGSSSGSGGGGGSAGFGGGSSGGGAASGGRGGAGNASGTPDAGPSKDSGATQGAGGGSAGAAGGPASDSGNSTCPGSGLAKFRPSNLPDPFVVPAGAPALTHTSSSCIFDTDDITGTTPQGPHFTCAASAKVTSPQVVTLSDGREAVVLPLESLTVPAGVTLKVAGRRPVIIAVSGDVIIHGSITASAGAVTAWFAGGAPARSMPYLPGLCPLDSVLGGGRPGPGSGGGASVPSSGTAIPGGMPYGADSLIPLVGGSSGGTGDFGASSGGPHGGGAIQIVSGTSILVSETASINMGGGAGYDIGGNTGSGGGSGGAILLEAPLVTIKGILAANGGGGGAGYLSHPQDASASDQPALGGSMGGGMRAGLGAAASVATGGDSAATGGGGGGVGRIRINTGCGGSLAISTSAIISPSESTGCFKSGSLL